MEQEIWKPVKGFEGLYEVSSIGRIRTSSRIVIAKDGRRMIIPSRIRLQSTDWHGYCYVKIRKNKKQYSLRVHRAVAEAFIDNPEIKPFVDHINTIKTDNRIENLRWVTAHENTQNEITLQRIKDACTPEEIQRQIQVKKDNGTWNGVHVFQYTKDGRFVSEYNTLTEATKSVTTGERNNASNISVAIDNPNKSAYGYKWYSKRIEPQE